MLDDLKWTRKERIKILNVNSDRTATPIPNPPEDAIRRGPGLFGKPDPQDVQHQRRQRETYQKITEIDYAQKGLAAFGVSSVTTSTRAIEMMDARCRELEPESLAREWGEKITEVHAQLLAQSHVAFSKHYVEDTISRISKRS